MGIEDSNEDNKKENREKKRIVLDLLIEGAISGIILTADTSHPWRIATNSKLWLEGCERTPMKIPIAAQKNQLENVAEIVTEVMD